MTRPRRTGLMMIVWCGGLMLTTASFVRAGSMAISQELDAEYSYSAGAATHKGDTQYGDMTEQHSDLSYLFSPQISKDWLLRFGAEWQYFNFGVPGNAPLPDDLQQLNATLGCDYQFGDQWLLRAELRPGIYGSEFHNLSARDFDIPFILGVTYLANPDLQWVFGILVDWRSQFPVLPAPGVRWKFADQWTLNGIFPRPRVEYDYNDRLQLYTGFEVEVGTFTVGDQFGVDHNIPKLNNATLDYFEYRVGAGVLWKLLPNVTIEAEAGGLLGRWISYVHEDTVLRSQPAPYVQLNCHVRL